LKIGEKVPLGKFLRPSEARSRRIRPANVAGAGLVAAILVFSPVFARAQETEAESNELETKNIFGFTSGTDIGPDHDRELELETNLAFGKRSGVYYLGDQRATLEYNPFAWLEVDTGVRATFNQIRSVDGLDDRTGANFGGVQSKFSFVLIHRTTATPIGLTISVEPEWSHIDDAGHATAAFSVETRIVIDTELVPKTLYAALNAIYQPQAARDLATTTLIRSDVAGVAGALSYRLESELAPGMKQAVVGAELEYLRSFDRLGFSRFNGDALSFGPTFYLHFNDTLFIAGAFSTQIAGRAVGDPNVLDLIHFTRNKAKLVVGIDF
jgi:hypothetical protein